MSCDIKLKLPIISVQLMNRRSSKLFVFVGDNISTINKKIFTKVENGEKLTAAETKIINEYECGNEWLKKGGYVQFVYDYINWDDNIAMIQNKIFYYLSDDKKNYFVLPKNQEIWIKNKGGFRIRLDLKYDTFDIAPSLELEKPEPDYKQFVNLDGTLIKKNKYKKNGNKILYSLIDVYDLNKNIIYVHNCADEIKYLTEEGLMTNVIKKGYISKYWPEYEQSANNDKIKKEYNQLRGRIERDKFIISFVKHNQYNPEINCHILIGIFQVKTGIYPTKQYRSEGHKYINDYKLVSGLRKKMGYDIPFIKYKDRDTLVKNKNYFIHEKSLIEGKIDIREWVLDVESKQEQELGQIRGIEVKFYIYTNKKGIRKYGTLTIFMDGTYEIKINFDMESYATFKQMEIALQSCFKIIKMINNFDYKISRKLKGELVIPEIRFRDGIIIYDKDIMTMKSVNINYSFAEDELIDLKNKDQSYVIENMSPYLIKSINSKVWNDFRYKRVSEYEIANEILMYIADQKSSTKELIIADVEKIFNISNEHSRMLYNKWDHIRNNPEKLSKLRSGIEVVFATKNIVSVRGVRSYIEIMMIKKLLSTILYIVKNYKTLKNNKQFEKYFLSPLSKSDYDDELDLEFELEDVADFDIDLDLELEVAPTKKEVEEEISEHKGVDKILIPTCKKKVGDTCEEVCEDRYYKARRLQSFDPKLFKYHSSKTKQYTTASRGCQSWQQPHIMKTNPDNDPKIDKESYTYALKYGSSPDVQNYYVCPQVWCPFCEMPIALSKVKDVKKKWIGEKECMTGICPNGKHQVLINEKMKQKNGTDAGWYPYFRPRSTHPDKLCIPCCGKNDPREAKSAKLALYRDCLGEEVEVEKETSSLYIASSETRWLRENKNGLLPPELARYFGSYCEGGGNLKNNQECYVRRGIRFDDRGQSFLLAIANLVSFAQGADKLDKKTLMKNVVANLDEGVFDNLEGGKIKKLFLSLENYKNFLLDPSQRINHKHVWDLMSRPHILSESGINIFLFSSVTIIVPLTQDVKYFYDMSKPSVFIIVREGNIYEPIYYLKNVQGKLVEQPFFEPMNKYVIKTYEIIVQPKEKYNINWKKMMEKSESEYNVAYDDYEKNIVYDKTFAETATNKKTIQYVDGYGKVTGAIINGFFIPTLPSPINASYLKVYEIPENEYHATLKFLQSQNAVVVGKTVIKNEKGIEFISGIVVESGRVVPVKKVKNRKDSLQIVNKKYYDDADHAIVNNIVTKDKKDIIYRKYLFEMETYERLRYELSRFLQESKNKKVKKTLRDVIRNQELMIDDKRKEIKAIIYKVLKGLITTEHKYFNIGNYTVPNIRDKCASGQGKSSSYNCVCKKGDCRLYVPSTNMYTGNKSNVNNYFDMIVEELLRNRFKRAEIMNDEVLEIINEDKHVEMRGQQYLIDDNTLMQRLKHLNKMKYKQYYDSDKVVYDELTPSVSNIVNIELGEEKVTTATTMEKLPKYYQTKFGDEYKILRYANDVDSMWFAFVAAINSVSNVELTIDKLKMMFLKFLQTSQLKVIRDIIKDNIPAQTKIFDSIVDEYQKEADVNKDSIILKFYRKVFPESYSDILTFTHLEKYVISSVSYRQNVFDIILTAKMLNINVIIFENVVADQPIEPYLLTHEIISNKYIILFHEKRGKISKYNLVIEKNTYLFDYNQLHHILIKEAGITKRHVEKKNGGRS